MHPAHSTLQALKRGDGARRRVVECQGRRKLGSHATLERIAQLDRHQRIEPDVEQPLRELDRVGRCEPHDAGHLAAQEVDEHGEPPIDRLLGQAGEERADLGRLAPRAQADIVVFDLGGSHLGPIFDPLKNLFLAGRGTDCRASFIAGRCVMEDFKVGGVDPLFVERQDEAALRLLQRRPLK